MSFDTTAKVSLTLDQLMVLVDQLSAKDTEKVLARLELKHKKDALARMRKTFSKVKMAPAEIDRIVESVRKERYQAVKAREARR